MEWRILERVYVRFDFESLQFLFLVKDGPDRVFVLERSVMLHKLKERHLLSVEMFQLLFRCVVVRLIEVEQVLHVLCPQLIPDIRNLILHLRQLSLQLCLKDIEVRTLGRQACFLVDIVNQAAVVAAETLKDVLHDVCL